MSSRRRRTSTASSTVWRNPGRRRSPCGASPHDDVGYREIFVSLDGESLGVLRPGDAITRETTPGSHRLRAHNTLFWKTLEVRLMVGEHARFMAVNRAGWGTYSVLAFFIGFLGAGPLYLTFEREDQGAHGP